MKGGGEKGSQGSREDQGMMVVVTVALKVMKSGSLRGSYEGKFERK